MSQSDYNIANADGATVRADINSQLDAIGSQNSGSTAPPVTFPYMRWFDTANQQLKERNGANTAWRTVAEVIDGELVPYSGGEPLDWVGLDARYVQTGGALAWESRAIGEEIWLDDSNPAVEVPPTGYSGFRYIKLTAGENGSGGYNEGVLINESVSGSAPLLEATAEINLPDSPFHGQTVRLLNTERRFVRAGASGAVEDDAFQGHHHNTDTNTERRTASGSDKFVGDRHTGNVGDPITGNHGEARVADETRPRNIGRTVYMRIL